VKKAIGYGLLVLSVMAWGAIAALPLLDISFATAAGMTTVLLICGEVSFFAGIALLGQDTWDKIKPWFKKRQT
jgi:hypothetical protein